MKALVGQRYGRCIPKSEIGKDEFLILKNEAIALESVEKIDLTYNKALNLLDECYEFDENDVDYPHYRIKNTAVILKNLKNKEFEDDFEPVKEDLEKFEQKLVKVCNESAESAFKKHLFSKEIRDSYFTSGKINFKR